MRDDRTPNLLIHERSPYLQQHAYNPVQWRPWSDAAFALARSENKPVFCSIGYATCHWCHVMEHESFEDPDVARLLNEHFICVKVDREERPDVDAIYMDVCQAMTGHGGWPLTVVMDAEQRPFFAGTYFPKHSRQGRIGLMDLLERLHSAWVTDRQRIDSSAADVVAYLRSNATADLRATVSDALDDALIDAHRRMFDDVHGGFGTQPKFPSPHHMMALLRLRAGRDEAVQQEILHMVTATLDAMRAGGIYDHVGGGLHRYATDREWMVPHFEKMLYDQAMIMMALTEAGQITGDALYRQTVMEIADYVRQELTSTDAITAGAFMSAQDADSEGVEGKYYIWTLDELHALGLDASLLSTLQCTAEGNYVDEASGNATGANILHVRMQDVRTVSADPAWAQARERLHAIRKERIAPLTDDKVLVDWNGLMVAALAKAARAFDAPHLTAMAVAAYERIASSDSHVVGSDRHIPLMLDDVAACAWAAHELHQTTGHERYRADAEERCVQILAQFHDATHGGLFTVGADEATSVLVRQKNIYDGAYPCGASIAAYVMALHEIENDGVTSVGKQLQAHAWGMCMMVCAAVLERSGCTTVTVYGHADADDVRAVRRLLHAAFLPDVTFLYEEAEALSVVVCRGRSCDVPMTTLDAVQAWIRAHQ